MKLPPLLFPDCDSLRAVNQEPFNRLPRVIGVGIASPLHEELSLTATPLLLANPLHVVVDFSVPVKQGWRYPRTSTSTRRPPNATLVRVLLLRVRRRGLRLTAFVNASSCLRLHLALGLAVMLPPRPGIRACSLDLRTA
uniref:Uncharacterized protein n=1 Tax=Phytophthora infestans TaxID=4787 RepID=Q572H1_PHYIN|nr:hypothetical protein PI49.0120c [Phytophthora infestans]